MSEPEEPTRAPHGAPQSGSPARFPPTRYHGSKARHLGFLEASLSLSGFSSALDAFGGSGAVSYWLKQRGLSVHFNDALRCNAEVGAALVENDRVTLSPERAERLGEPEPGASYDDFVERTFGGVFFLDHENRWLDVAAQNIARLPCRFERAIARYALFQACLAKRPYGLFHRANLSMRTRDVPRSFGNKASWDRPFAQHFARFVARANAAVFAGERASRSSAGDAEACEPGADLVYLDPPYFGPRGSVDYLDFYHFLEGLTEYHAWPSRIDRRLRHLPYERRPSPWCERGSVLAAFERLFDAHRRSTLAVSYRDDGVPSIDDIARALSRAGKRVSVFRSSSKPYVLSTRRSAEVLLVGE